ncbi:unnamed protein product [Rotaria sordida]|uniref:Uncharacterized protein n=1 Tax=Rotaria sordida TaxID=392033 RepID=A0A814LLS4_9BILA|nr:unnamed protein product [Rotaria sordida]CAF1118474.1 unnamed protein product [Rotaria sordida]CAF3942676.1 unnamed protein product [Rotaria sordida]
MSILTFAAFLLVAIVETTRGSCKYNGIPCGSTDSFTWCCPKVKTCGSSFGTCVNRPFPAWVITLIIISSPILIIICCIICTIINTKNSRRVSNISTDVEPFTITQSRTLFRGRSPPPFMEDSPPSYEMAMASSLQKPNMQRTDILDESNNSFHSHHNNRNV